MSIKYRFATNLKDIETRKKHLPSRLKRIVVQNESKLLTNAKPRKSHFFHAWRYLSCRRKCFAASIFVHAKNLCKLYVDSDSPKFLLGSFFSASSQAEFASFFFFFSRLSKESNETFTNASPHLLVCGIALCTDSCVSMRLQGPSSLLSIFSKSKPRRGKALQTV